MNRRVSRRAALTAKKAALEQRGLLRAYLNAEVRDQVVAGDVLCAQMWATTAQQARRGNPALQFVHPEEGFGLYADCAVVLRESRRRELAHEFINNLPRAEVAARAASASDTATANGAARQLLGEALSSNRILYPDAETLRHGEWFGAMPAKVQRLRDRLGTEIMSA